MNGDVSSNDEGRRTLYSGPFAGLNDWLELRCWRFAGRDLEAFLARVLAAQGDAAEPELIQLQHTLADLLRPAALRHSEQSNSQRLEP